MLHNSVANIEEKIKKVIKTYKIYNKLLKLYIFFCKKIVLENKKSEKLLKKRVFCDMNTKK